MKTFFYCSSPTFSRENRTCEEVKTFFCFIPTFSDKNRTSEDVKTFFYLCSSPIFSGVNTNCCLARGKIWSLILADFGTQTEKGCPSLPYENPISVANFAKPCCVYSIVHKDFLTLTYHAQLSLTPTCRKIGRFNLPIACSIVRNLPVKISPIYMLKNDTLFMKY